MTAGPRVPHEACKGCISLSPTPPPALSSQRLPELPVKVDAVQPARGDSQEFAGLGRRIFGPALSPPGPVLGFVTEKGWGGFGGGPGPDTECPEDERVLRGRLWGRWPGEGRAGGVTLECGQRFLEASSPPPGLGRGEATSAAAQGF